MTNYVCKDADQSHIAAYVYGAHADTDRTTARKIDMTQA